MSADYTDADVPVISLTSDDVVSLLTIAAVADLNPDGTDARLMALVYTARRVIEVGADGKAKTRPFTLSYRRTP